MEATVLGGGSREKCGKGREKVAGQIMKKADGQVRHETKLCEGVGGDHESGTALGVTSKVVDIIFFHLSIHADK
jgi:hypothetical protein